MRYALRHPSFYVGAFLILATISLMDIVQHRFSSLLVDGTLIFIVFLLFLFVELRVFYAVYPYFHRHHDTRLLSCKRYYCPGCRALLRMGDKKVLDKNIGATR